MSEPRVTPLRLVLPESGKVRVVRAALALNLEQCARGENASGGSFPQGKGKKKQLDMRDSGELLGSAEVDESGYRFTADYADDVDARFNFSGVAPDSMHQLEEQAQAILLEELLAEQ